MSANTRIEIILTFCLLSSQFPTLTTVISADSFNCVYIIIFISSCRQNMQLYNFLTALLKRSKILYYICFNQQ
jgi:hypothetical protein